MKTDEAHAHILRFIDSDDNEDLIDSKLPFLMRVLIVFDIKYVFPNQALVGPVCWSCWFERHTTLYYVYAFVCCVRK